MGSCAVEGGCPTDYIAISIAIVSFFWLLWRSIFPCLVHKVPRTNGSAFWIPAIQVIASFNLLLSIVMSLNLLKFRKRFWWQSCYIWAVWIEGPLGFGLVLSCRITQAFQLYYIFVKRRLPLVRSYIFLPVIISPWIAAATLIHVRKLLNNRCHMGIHWAILVMLLHTSNVAALIGFTGAIRHIEFRFDEVKDLWRGIIAAATAIGLWVVSYILNEVHDEISGMQVASRFFLLIAASFIVLALFSMSSSQPLLSQISLRRRERPEFESMGQALGIPDSGMLSLRDPAPVVDPNEPLEKLLLNRRFRQSFMAFADSCLAGESMHFYNEVHELGKIPSDDPVRRIYMARHIIAIYVVAGAEREINISHRTREEILRTTNLARPELFNNALNELLQLMKTNLAKDYWSSMFFIKYKEEARIRPNGHEMEQMTGWNFSPRLSAVRGVDDPFHQDHLVKGSSCDTCD